MDRLRITGMSGIDTESMVTQLMQAERMKVDKQYQAKELNKWRQEQYNDVNKELANFILDVTKEFGVNRKSYGSMIQDISSLSWVKKASSSNEDIFTAKATAKGITGTHSVKVKQLADGVNVASVSEVKAGTDKATKDTKLSDLGVAVGNISFKINGTEITLDNTGDDKTIDDLVTAINSATTASGDLLGLQASFDDQSGRFFLSTKETGENAQIKITDDVENLFTGANNKFNMAVYTTMEKVSESTAAVGTATNASALSSLSIADGSIRLKLGDKEATISFNATDTIEQLVEKINNSGLGITASFDDTTHKLNLNAKNQVITVLEDTQELFTGTNKFNMSTSDDYLGGKVGQSAIIDFDGAENIEYDSNQFTINGIEMDLKSVSADPENDTFKVSVDTDVDAVYDKIKFFVDKYNELIDKLNKKISEKRYRDFNPLTKEQKEAMNENDIKLWEEKAKSGLLKDDEIINRTLQSMRSGLYQKVEGLTGQFSQLTQIGITTGEWKDKGKLVISDDPQKGLKAAIKKDVDGVLELLFKPSSIIKSDATLTKDEKDTKRKESGIINRLFDDLVTGMKDIVNKSGTGDNASLYRDVKSNILIDFVTKMGSISNLDKDIFSIEKKIKDEERRLKSVEESYWRKFTAMEKALSQMQSQSSWLAGQLGGM
ncbi:flagellar filament capping protein FliD [Crassaminicella indica]|uniref:Flagellar hook-associated protein 2 n=1 Tax=Crassaminicella indica TaxID=2855394 RepID=A0ABX8R831_9CLOT|nr:flagellar filament capping protein FliD [Crassaminicella indica]QXM05190.1 flagellar filament capping protein FliD [Crassaminicella indica]